MPELVLDSEHRYWYGGRRIPGVTQILSELGLIDKRWFTEDARRRGTAVHAAVHYHLEKDLDWSRLDERIRGFVDAAISFLDDAHFVPEQVETRVVHLGPPIWAGTLDAAGLMWSDPAVADWKSGGMHPVTGLQTSGYDLALGPIPGASQWKRRRRLGVELRNNGTYRKTDFDDRRDYQRMLAAADLHAHYVFKPNEKAEESHERSAVA